MARRIYHPPPSRNNILWQGVTRPPPPQKKLDSVCVKQRFYGELSNVPRPSAMRIKRTWNPIVPLLGLYAINPLQLAGINLFQICLVSYSQVTFLFLLRINLILVLTFSEKHVYNAKYIIHVFIEIIRKGYLYRLLCQGIIPVWRICSIKPLNKFL